MLSSDRCPHCNTRVPRTGTRCPVCGAPVSTRRLHRSADPFATRVVPLPSRENRQTHRPNDGGSGPPAAA